MLHSKKTLEGWVEDFVTDRGSGATVRVVDHDAPDGARGGLVVLPPRDFPTTIYMQPTSPGSSTWHITIEPHTDLTVLTSRQVNELATEVLLAAELCAHLEAESRRAAGEHS